MPKPNNNLTILLTAWLAVIPFLVSASEPQASSQRISTSQYPSIQAIDPASIAPDNLFPKVVLETSAGDIELSLDRYRAPITVNNFLAYVVTGSYDNTLFHRVVKNFVVQGGGYGLDYTEKYTRSAIYNESGNGLKNKSYSVAMAREKSPHSATNQFYVNLDDNDSLDPGKDWGYAVFGTVTKGMDVLDAIAAVPTGYHGELGWDDVPLQPVTIKRAYLLEQD